MGTTKESYQIFKLWRQCIDLTGNNNKTFAVRLYNMQASSVLDVVAAWMAMFQPVRNSQSSSAS